MSAQALDSKLRNVAVFCPTWVGDTVMATPVYRALRAAFPDATLYAVVQRTLAPLLEGSPWFDNIVMAMPKSTLSPWSDARLLRALHLDAVLLLPNSLRSAFTARLAGVPRRIGYARDRRSWLLSDAIPPPAPPPPEPRSTPISAVDYYADLAHHLIGKPISDRALELHVTDKQQTQADRLLRGIDGPYVVLNPGANKPAKRWPPDRFAAVADALWSRHHLHTVITGAPNEAGLARRIESLCKSARVMNLAGTALDLGSLKGVIRRAALMMTNDTGPRHIAAAFRIPTVALFGPTDHRWTTLVDARERIVLAEPFLPEQLIADRHPQACAIEKITVGDALANAEALLASDDD